jgi:hypothetical protein
MTDQLTLSVGDTPVSPSVKPGSEGAMKMTATSGRQCLSLSRSTSRLGLLEKMCLVTYPWASTMCYLTWRPQATKRGYLLFRLVPKTPDIDETEYGLLHTPTAKGKFNSRGEPKLSAQVLLYPTPDTQGFHNDGALEKLKHMVPRTEYVGMTYRAGKKKQERHWPTPTSSMHRGRDRLDFAIEGGEKQNGRLNPQWVEWLMGFPEGWTDLKR